MVVAMVSSSKSSKSKAKDTQQSDGRTAKFSRMLSAAIDRVMGKNGGPGSDATKTSKAKVRRAAHFEYEYEDYKDYEEYYGGGDYSQHVEYDDHGSGGGGRDSHHGHHGSSHGHQIYRDTNYEPRPEVVRNPRDNRFFPGVEPAGIEGIDPKLYHFLVDHVSEVAFQVQSHHHGRRRRRRRRRRSD